MQFEFKNLGTIKEAQLEMGNLTIICGKNNTGKTYLTYGVWGILDDESHYHFAEGIFDAFLKKDEIKKELVNNNECLINLQEKKYKILYDNIVKGYNTKIEEVFAVTSNFFSQAVIRVREDKELVKKGIYLKITSENDFIKIKISLTESVNDKFELTLEKNIIDEIVLLLLPQKDLFKNIFLLPAQRDSIELFYKALDKRNADVIKEFQRTKSIKSLDELPRFPQPIEKLIDFARDLTRQVIKTESFLAKEHPELLKEVENLLGVTYEVSGDEVLIKDKYSTQKVPAYMASTSVRSLMHLHFWLKHKAQKGDLLMIDEPELNLHPENQIKMARLFAKLVNAGIKVWITTHSDYIIKELNNCLMLSQEMENKNELLEELGYKENEILQRDDIRAYIARYDEKLEGCTVDKVEFDEYGMVMTTFDDQARKINRIAHRLADEIDEKQLKQTSLEND